MNTPTGTGKDQQTPPRAGGIFEPPKQLWTILGDAPAPSHLVGKAAKRNFVRVRCKCGTEAVHPRGYIEGRRSLGCGCESLPKLRNAHAAFVRALNF